MTQIKEHLRTLSTFNSNLILGVKKSLHQVNDCVKMRVIDLVETTLCTDIKSCQNPQGKWFRL